MTRPFDLVIENATVLTMDNSLTLIEDGIVGVIGDTIAYVGQRQPTGSDSPTGQTAQKTIDARGGLVLPGLINCHTHAAMTLFRGLADDLPLMDWLNHFIFPVESRMDGEFVFSGALLACAEMILSGTTTFCDMYLFENETARAADQAGIRAMIGEVLYDFESPNYGSIDKGFAYTESLIEAWENHPRISVAVEPHALYTCSPDLLRQAGAMAVKHAIPLILHVAETLSELDALQERYGKKPFEHMESLGILGSHVIADHCVFLDDSEISRISDHGVRVVTDPESNMKLASGVAPIPDLQARGIPVGLGTDGCASNNNLDMFHEMDCLAKVHKVHRMDPTVMDAVTVLRCATIEGARVLGMSDRIGSIEIGKKADIIVIDTDKPHLTPMYNPYSHLVYSAGGSDVRHTIIDGNLVMENGRLLSIDPDSVMAEARRQAKRVRLWTRSTS